MTFLENIFDRLQQSASAPVVRKIRDGKILSLTGGELLAMVQVARKFLVARGLKKGDRCALLAPNGIRWVAMDLALMAEGIIVVPLYARQAPAELAGMMKDSTSSLICCGDETLAAEIRKAWPAAPEIALFDGIFGGDIFRDERATPAAPCRHAGHDAVTIIYTSGTSGEPRGVVLNAANVGHMLGCTNARLDRLMGPRQEPDRIFQYTPFCFAAAWILLLTALSRNSILTLSTDLTNLSDDLKLAAPNYFINVPIFLERVHAKIKETIRRRGRFVAYVFTRAQRHYVRRRNHEGRFFDSLCLWLASAVMFPAIRKNIGPNLKALICGSAPLAVETQLFFMMLGIPVLQVYGLTETTGICTLDDPAHFEAGRVGPAVPGVDMTLADTGEILVRGPNIFPGYWQRPAETAKALEGGWFHTGDQGEVDARGNWRITGRLNNLIILNSGHNVAPEPLEDALVARLPEAGQVMLVGNRRGFLAAIVTAAGTNGSTRGSANGPIQSAIDALNAGLPHYKQIRAFHVAPEPFSIEGGLLTVNGKLKRDAITARYAAEIEQLYQKNRA